MILNDLKWLNEILNDAKRHTVSLQPLSLLVRMAVNGWLGSGCHCLWLLVLFGMLCCMEAKHGLYKKKIFDDFRHLKYGYGDMWWKYSGLSIKRSDTAYGWDRKRNNGQLDTVRSRQKRWLCHILRHDSLLTITLEGQIQGKKVYGRPRTRLLDWLLKMKEGNISYEELKSSPRTI